MAPLDTVTIPRADYERLLSAAEELEDIREAREVLHKLEAGEEELIPSEYVNRLIDGENPLRVFRDLRGMTQKALSEASGVNRVYIADIEAGRKPGSAQALKALAEALAVTVDDLIP